MTSILLDRSFDISDDNILYHYCSAATMQAVLDFSTIRFSDVYMMNDFSEMRYAYEVFEQAATELLAIDIPGIGKIPIEFLDKLDAVISPQQLSVHPVIACFSLNDDILGQWARYGSNGAGFCLGFSGKALKSLPVTIGKVNYDRSKQIEEMKVAIGAIYMQNIEKGAEFNHEVRQSAQLLGAEMAFVKHPSFVEEQEVRLLHLLDVHLSPERCWLSDEGGSSNGVEVAGEKVKFRLADETIIAYIDIKIGGNFAKYFVREIKLGPKNRNGPGNILYLAGSAGLEHTIISHSICPYR